ncbi:hypothetical protein Hanom_Chr01g00000271 [Helianthus anomalus]
MSLHKSCFSYTAQKLKKIQSKSQQVKKMTKLKKESKYQTMHDLIVNPCYLKSLSTYLKTKNNLTSSLHLSYIE